MWELNEIWSISCPILLSFPTSVSSFFFFCLTLITSYILPLYLYTPLHVYHHTFHAFLVTLCLSLYPFSLPPSPFITVFATISPSPSPSPSRSFFVIFYKFNPGSSSLSSFLSPSNLEYPPLFPVVLVLDELVEIKAADICVRDDRPFTIHIHIHIRKHNNQH